MFYRTSWGMLDVLIGETDLLYANVSISGSDDLLEIWCVAPRDGQPGTVDTDLGRYGEFGFAMDGRWPETQNSYSRIGDPLTFFDSRIYRGLEELLDEIERSKGDRYVPVILYVLFSILIKGPLSIKNGREWDADTLQQSLFEHLDRFVENSSNNQYERYAFLFEHCVEIEWTDVECGCGAYVCDCNLARGLRLS